MYWVAIECEFQCRACGHLAPLNQLDLDGSVRCLSCGLDQAFAQSSWRVALDAAHALGDLGGGPAEGKSPHPLLSVAQENPHRGAYAATHTQAGFVVERGLQVPTSLRLTAQLVDPTCANCNVTLAIQVVAGGRARSTCPRCGEVRAYALPPNAAAFAPALRAVICDEHRSDCAATRVEEDHGSAGVTAFSCPSCGGGLQVAAGTRLVTCQYCRTSSRIPQKTWYRGGGTAKKERWWLAFDGPSLARKKLERDPGIVREPNDDATDLKVVDPPKRKRPETLDLAMVLLIPMLFVIVVALFDFAVLAALDVDLGL